MINNSSIADRHNGTSPSDERPSIEVTVFVVIYVLLSVLVITGNILVIQSYITNTKLRKSITAFFVSLAASDLCVGLVPIPYWISVLLCPAMLSLKHYFTPLDVFSALASIFNLVAISVERRIVVSNTRLTRRRGWLKRLNVTMICVAWFMALLISICNGFIDNTITRTVLMFLVGFVVPLVVLIMIYVDIYRLVRHTQEQVSRQHSSTNEDRSSRQISSTKARVSQNSNNKTKTPRFNTNEERKTARTVVIITTFFVIAWTPFFVCSLLSTFALPSLPSGKKLRRLIDFVKLMHYSNSAVNPFVYAYRNEDMKKTMVSILKTFVNYLCCVSKAKRRNLLI